MNVDYFHGIRHIQHLKFIIKHLSMEKIGHLFLWLLVNLVFGFLQLIYDYSTKMFNDIPFDTKPLIVGGSFLFFCSGFIISVAFDSWVSRREAINARFASLHIVFPILVLVAIVIVYASASNMPRTISPLVEKNILSRLLKGNIIILITTLVYGTFSKFEQLQEIV